MIWTTLPRSDLGHGLAGHWAGSGPELVLIIHGVGLRLEAWNALSALLGTDFRTCAVDMPGHGGSGPVTSANLTLYTERFAALLSETGPAFVAGHSMGAMITLDLAARYPDRVLGIAALNAIYRRTPAAAAAVQSRAAGLRGGANSDPGPTLTRWFGEAETPEAKACRAWLTEADAQGYATAYATFAHHDGPADSDLGALRCAALFLTGAKDTNSTPAMSEAMASKTPKGRAVILRDAAHMAPMTHPAPIAAELRRTFRVQP